jgi:hypothetical protein
MNPTDKKIPPIFSGGKIDLKVDFQIRSLQEEFHSFVYDI